MQSHYFGVGSIVSWAEAGVGAIANQSVPGLGYGARGLDLMRDGTSAPDALKQLLSGDEQESVRQLALVDRHGRVAVHTGSRCIREAGHRVADGVSAQANIMERATVPHAMVETYQAAQGDLADRLIAADNAELAFWRGVALASSGREEEARPLLAAAYRENEGWRELLRRLPAAGLFPDDRDLLDRLV